MKYLLLCFILTGCGAGQEPEEKKTELGGALIVCGTIINGVNTPKPCGT